MSVRPTQTKSRYPRRSKQPHPPPEQDLATDPEVGAPADPGLDPAAGPLTAEPAAAEPVTAGTTPAGTTAAGTTPAAVPSPVSRADRKSQRAARRTRRNLAIACGLLVAVCLVLTILIVNMARNRPTGLDLPPRPVAAALGLPVLHPSTIPVPDP